MIHDTEGCVIASISEVPPFHKPCSNPGFFVTLAYDASVDLHPAYPFILQHQRVLNHTQPVSHAHRCISILLRLTDTPIDESHVMFRCREMLISAAGRHSCTVVGYRPSAT